MRTLLLSFAIVLLSMNIHAQNEIGIKIGGNVNSATINGLTESLIPQVNSYTGLSTGVYFSTQLGNNLNFRPELNYTQKGFGMDASTSFDLIGLEIPIGVEAITKINTVNAQLPISYSFVNTNNIELYGYAGPTLGYATSASVQTRANFLFDVNIMKFDIKLNDNSNRRFEVGALAGLGLGIKTASGKVLLETEYQHGFNSTLKTPIVNLGATNKSFGFSLGYAINL